MSSIKVQRTAELLHGFLAQELRRLTDPRLELITLSAVELSPDLKTAWIYWSVLTLNQAEGTEPVFPTPSRKKEVTEALSGATGLLKHRIAEELNLRYTPQLVFRYDVSFETGSRIDSLVKKAAS